MKTFLKSVRLASIAALCLAVSGCSDDEPAVPKGNYQSRTIALTEAEKAASAQSNQFAWQLFEQCIGGNNDNTVLSPLSANICLSMLANATAGNSQSQLLDALGFEEQSMASVNSLNKKLASDICRLDEGIKLSMANSFWYDKNLNPKPDFVAAVRDNYGVESYVINPGTFLSDVNRWCDRKTNGLIKRILDEDPHVKFALVNALYFKGMWHYSCKFDKANTKADIFTNADESTARINYMCAKNSYSYHSADMWCAMSIPFGGCGFSFSVILPNEGCTIEDCLPSVQEWATDINTERREGKYLDLMLPKFKVQAERDLIDVLKAMGVTDIFDESKADLSNLTDVPMVINLAKQKVSFEVNEEGAEAAAVTITGGDYAACFPEYEPFHVNRPFIYMISERSTGAILFLGCIKKF